MALELQYISVWCMNFVAIAKVQLLCYCFYDGGYSIKNSTEHSKSLLCIICLKVYFGAAGQFSELLNSLFAINCFFLENKILNLEKF